MATCVRILPVQLLDLLVMLAIWHPGCVWTWVLEEEIMTAEVMTWRSRMQLVVFLVAVCRVSKRSGSSGTASVDCMSFL